MVESSAQGAVDRGQKDRCQVSDVRCQNESSDVRVPTDRRPLTTDHCLRLGLLCVKGLREEAGRSIVRARSEKPFMSLDDLHRRVPELRKDELGKLAAVGALNFIETNFTTETQRSHRDSQRRTLWSSVLAPCLCGKESSLTS